MKDAIRPRVFSSDPMIFFASGFERIRRERMQGLDLLNPRLNVHVLPFRRTGCHWIGIVVTPWSVAAVIACGDLNRWRRLPAGKTFDISLAGGDFTFLSVRDTVLGEYLMCSLKSPVHEFADQAAADAFAKTCLQMMTTRPVTQKTPAGTTAALSRRALFTRPMKEIASC